MLDSNVRPRVAFDHRIEKLPCVISFVSSQGRTLSLGRNAAVKKRDGTLVLCGTCGDGAGKTGYESVSILAENIEKFYRLAWAGMGPVAGAVPQPVTNLADRLIKRTPLSELGEDCLSTATAAQDKAQAPRWGHSPSTTSLNLPLVSSQLGRRVDRNQFNVEDQHACGTPRNASIGQALGNPQPELRPLLHKLQSFGPPGDDLIHAKSRRLSARDRAVEHLTISGPSCVVNVDPISECGCRPCPLDQDSIGKACAGSNGVCRRHLYVFWCRYRLDATVVSTAANEQQDKGKTCNACEWSQSHSR